MRSGWLPGALFALVTALPTVAVAAEIPFTGTLEILEPLVPLTASADGVAILSPDGSLEIPEMLFVFSAARQVGTTLVSRFEMQGRNGSGRFARGAETVFGTMPLIGTFLARLNAPPATVSAVSLPLSVIGGALTPWFATTFATVSGSVISASLSGSRTWHTGVLTATGFAHTPGGGVTSATIMTRGEDLRTPGNGGRLQLVTPVVLSVFEGGEPIGEPPGFARLSLDFVPEPSTLLLVLGSLAAVAGACTMRRRV
jgi:hypothetical protein